MNRRDLDRVIEAIDPVIAPHGFKCLEVDWGKDRVLQVFVDRICEGEVGLEDCVIVNRALLDCQDLDDQIDGSYELEVSSPGLERPLRRHSDFAKYIGNTVEVKLEERVLDRVHGKGRLVAVSDEGEITIETARGEWRFPLHCLRKACLVHDW